MNTHEMSAMAVIIADVLSFGILCLVIYNLQRKVDKFEKAMANQSLMLKISGKDLIGVLERQKEVKPMTEEQLKVLRKAQADYKEQRENSFLV